MKLRTITVLAVVLALVSASAVICLSGMTTARTVNTDIWVARLGTVKDGGKVASSLLTKQGQTVLVHSTGYNLSLNISFDAAEALEGALEITSDASLEVTVIGGDDNSNYFPLAAGTTTVELNCHRLEPEQEEETETQAEPETEYESPAKQEEETETQAEPENEYESPAEQKEETETQAEPETEYESPAEQKEESETQAESESESESQTEQESEIESQTETESESESQTEQESESESQTETESESESQTEAESEIEPQPEMQISGPRFTVTWRETTADGQEGEVLTAEFVLTNAPDDEDMPAGHLTSPYTWYCREVGIAVTTDGAAVIAYADTADGEPGAFPPFTRYEINGHSFVLYDGGYIETAGAGTVYIDLSEADVSGLDPQNTEQNQIKISSGGSELIFNEIKAPGSAAADGPLVLTDGAGAVVIDKYLLYTIVPSVTVEQLTTDKNSALKWEANEFVTVQVQDDGSVLLTADHAAAGTYRITFVWEDNGEQIYSLSTEFYVRHQRTGQGGEAR